ncbi:methylmalonyl-CoA carboxyltransferase [Salicibibacter cibarius]|uniref:Methylmalonyl-CoA carboxyltransferase n=1 Tax=Salicibibacter cibarius TaxID=2743000 RepID=A0A7T6Z6N1_9BACI|nr:carboxyl transferase domain-containing protein [Salicibibacter cibarius]QQK77797.1 methylmalonyl-CoA carboxyltransferase [Salicibibacter cibarius]
MKFEKNVKEHEERKMKAKSMGGEEKLSRRRKEGIMNARERIDYLLDSDSFYESGLFATSILAQDREKTPADGKVAGFGKINGRDVGVVSNDFTVKGASSSQVNGRKMEYIKNVSKDNGFPAIFLGESSGARMPDIMGARNIIGINNDPGQYMRLREVPWAAACLGNSFGNATWYSIMSDFTVMKKGACLAISSPRLVELATKKDVDYEELGGWKLHTEVTGMVDLAVDSDEEALDAIKKYLSYLPSHCNEPPPRKSVPAGSDDSVNNILDLIPESQKQVFDVRKVIQCIVDKDSYFEMKDRFGKSLVTALARIDGKSVGIIANNPMFKGGVIDADAADKAISFLVHCDSYNIPIVMMADQPGFQVGVESERNSMPGKAINWLNALALVTVPKIAIIMRKSYGLAVRNMGGSGNADEVVAWWTSEVSFMDPHASVSIVYGINESDDPDKYQEYIKEASRDTSAYDLASVYGAKDVIDPRETRDYLKRILEVYSQKKNNGVGQHLLKNWPTGL